MEVEEGSGPKGVTGRVRGNAVCVAGREDEDIFALNDRV